MWNSFCFFFQKINEEVKSNRKKVLKKNLRKNWMNDVNVQLLLSPNLLIKALFRQILSRQINCNEAYRNWAIRRSRNFESKDVPFLITTRHLIIELAKVTRHFRSYFQAELTICKSKGKTEQKKSESCRQINSRKRKN